MVRTYKRKTDRGQWLVDNMKNAIKAVLEQQMGFMLASKTYGVPRTSLQRKVNFARKNPEKPQLIKVPLGPKTTVFTVDEENELASYIIDMESRLFGLTTRDVKVLGYQLAIRNGKAHPFKEHMSMAGRDWLYGFLKRHPELAIRKPESTSAARAAGFNKVVVADFYKLLGKLYDEHKFAGNRIYNCDETGVSIVPKSKCKILALKGRKQVGALTSAERGATITVEVCFSATGNYIPPMMIFPRKRMKPELMVNAPEGAWGVCSDSGWITAELFLGWFKKFITYTGATKENRVLLLVDGHATHTKSVDVIDEARANGVEILSFPPHTTHRLQPLDVAFMKPVSTYYDQAVTSWLRSNPGLVVSTRQVAELFGKAFIQSATMSTAVNGFKKCGVWPYDPQIFTESDFLASMTTDIPGTQNLPLPVQPNENETQQNSEKAKAIQAIPTNMDIINQTNEDDNTMQVDTVDDPQPGCSSWLGQSPPLGIVQPVVQDTVFTLASPKQLLPVPVTSQKKRISRARGKTTIITSSPYKQELEEAIRQKERLAQDKENRKMERQRKRQEKEELKQVKEGHKKQLIKGKTKEKKSAKRVVFSSSESEDETDNTPCLYCNGGYLESKEEWIMCLMCGKWAHCSCAGVDDDDPDATHVCALCIPDK